MRSSRRHAQWTREKIIARISELRSAGEDLSYTCTAARDCSLLRGAKRHFGSWKGAIEAAGINYDRDVRKLPKWTRELIVEAIKGARRWGVDLSWTSVVRHPTYAALAYAAIRRSGFGSWDAALQAAGTAPGEVRRYEAWDCEKVLAGIRERARGGLALNAKTMQAEDSRLFNAALKRYAGWDVALRAAGVDPAAVYKRRRWDKARIREEIRCLWQAGEDMASPHMRGHHSALYSAACKHFGSWTIARSACGIRKGVRKPRQG